MSKISVKYFLHYVSDVFNWSFGHCLVAFRGISSWNMSGNWLTQRSASNEYEMLMRIMWPTFTCWPSQRYHCFMSTLCMSHYNVISAVLKSTLLCFSGSCDWCWTQREFVTLHEPQLQSQLWDSEVDRERRCADRTLHFVWYRCW